MSKQVDERVVEMRFDNKQFEQGVQTSMSTIDKLKEKLSFKGASKGLDELTNKIGRFDMNPIGKAVETVRTKFSALQVMGITALTNITNTAVNAGKRIMSALTIDPIKSGFQEYETQINAVQTILANTESKGTTLQQVNAALDELNHYADLTIYNFTEMTRNIGTFTAAGVDLKTSVTAIQGIANLAAVSGSNAQQASTAMYQLSQALAAGTVKLQDWNSVVNAGMGGQVFQDALKETARVHGIAIDDMIKKEGSFRETLQKGWLTSEILTETLSHFTMAADEGTEEWKAYKKELMDTGYSEKQAEAILKLSRTATDAATKVKTFTQLWDTLKEAAQSGWTQSWEIMVGDFEEAKSFLTDISNRVSTMISDSANARNAVLSEGLSTGWKQLLDAGIADEEGYKKSLEKVAKEHGVSIDKMVKHQKKLDESLTDSEAFQKALVSGLKDGKINSDILSESVHKLSKKMSRMSIEELKAAGLTTDAVIQIKKLSKGLKDGSVSMDDFVTKMERSSGRENIINSLWNTFNSVLAVIKPVKEAFRDIFPSTTGDELYNITVALEKFTEKLTISGDTAEKLKRTAKGAFAVIDIGVEALKAFGKGLLDIVKGFTGFSGSILDAGASLGDALVNLRDCIVNNNLFGKSIGTVTSFISSNISEVAKYVSSNNILQKSVQFLTNLISKATDAISNFGNSMSKSSKQTKEYSGIVSFLKGVWGLISSIGSAIGDALSFVINNITNMFLNGDIFDVINNGLFTGLLIGVNKFVKNLSGSLENVGGIFDNVRECLEAYQDKLKAGTLMQIAKAIAILAASLFIIATIDGDKLANALAGISVLFGELLGSIKIFTKFSDDISGVTKSISLMIGLSTAILILSVSLKSISKISWSGLAKGLLGIAGVMGELLVFMKVLSGFEKKAKIASKGLITLSVSMLIFSKAIKSFGDMDIPSIIKGLTGMGLVLTEIVAFSHFTEKSKGLGSIGLAMVLLGTSMKIFASALKDFGNMQWDEIVKGLTAMAGALTEVTVAVNFMPKNMIGIGVGLVAVSAALMVLANAFGKLGGMSLTEIGKGTVAMGVALAELAVALNFMNGTLAGSAALVVAAGALATIVPVMLILGSMSLPSIGKGLIALAGAFTVIGVAGALLTPLTPTLLGLAAAFGIFGASVLAIGTGLTLAGVGISTLATSLSVGATAIVAGLGAIITGFIGLIPQIADGFGKILVSFAKVIGECAPQLADSFLKLIASVLKSLATYTPQIVDSLLTFLVGVINALAKHIPDLIAAAMNLIGQLIKGIIDAFNGLDTNNLLNGLKIVGLLSGLVVALSAISGFIPGAMAALLGLGGVIAELTLILAAIGGLSKIPGVQELVTSGGKFLAKIGYAIGDFVGSIISGFGAGITSGLPEIGSNLSKFIINLTPFLAGIKMVDSSVLSSTVTLTKAIIALTAANVINSITSFITGKDSFEKFGKSIVQFGKAMVQYSTVVSGNVNHAAVTASVCAGTMLAGLAKALPNSGGVVSLFTGDNRIDKFGKELVKFGDSMSQYSEKVSGINTYATTESAKAASELVKMSGSIGKDYKNLTSFGKALKSFGNNFEKYSKSVSKVNASQLTAVNKAIKSLATISRNVNASGFTSLSKGLSALAKTSIEKFASNFQNAGKKVNSAVTGFIASFIAAINQKEGTVKNLGKDLAMKFFIGFAAKRSKVFDTFKSVATSGEVAIRGKRSDFEKAGVYLVEGFVKGIRGHINEAAKASAEMARKADKSARKELKVKSPSRKFKEIGMYCVQGFALGLTSTTALLGLNKSVKKVFGENLTKAVKKTLDIRGSLKYGTGAFDKYLKYFAQINNSFLSTYRNEKVAAKAITEFGHKLYLASDTYKNDKQNIADQKKQLKQYQRDKAKLEKKINTSQKGSYYYDKQSLQEYDKELAKSYTKQAKINTQIAKYSKSSSKASKEKVKQLKKELASINEAIEKTTKKRNRLQSDVNKYTKYDKAEKIQEKIDNLNEQYEKETKKYQEKRSKIQADISKLEGKKDKKSLNKIKDLKQDLKDLDSSISKSATGKKIASLNKQLDSLGGSATATLKTLKKESSSVDKELSKNLKKRATIQNKIDKLSKKTDAKSKKQVKMLKSQLKDLDKTIDKSYSKKETLTKKMKQLQAKIEKYSKDGRNSSKQKVKDLKSQLKDVEKNIKDTNKEIEKSNKEMLKHEIEVWKEYRDNISTAISETLDPLKQSIDNQMDLFSKFGSDEISKSDILTNMESQLNGVEQWNKQLELLASRGIAKGLLEKLREMGPQSASYVHAFVKMTDAELESANMMFERSSKATANTLLTSMSDSLSAAQKWGDNMVKLSKTNLNADILKSLSEQGIAGADYVEAFLTMTPEQIEEFNKMYAKSLKIPNSVADEVIASVAYSGAKASKGFTKGLADSKENMVSAVSDILTEVVKNSFGIDLKAQASKSGKKTAKSVENGVKSKKKSASKTGKDFGNTIVKAITSVLTKSKGKNVAANFCSGILDTISKTVGSSKSKSSTKEMGVQVAAGLAAGLASTTALLAIGSGANAMTGTLTKTTKKNLKVHSPSKVFYEIGEYTVQGFVNALKEGTGLVSASAEDLTKATADSASLMMKQISSIIENGIDDQPRITPVLDTSNIESGSRQLNAMLNRKQAIRISESMNPVAKSQNGVNSMSNPITQTGNSYQLIQNNYSPKALSRIDIYRQTKNQFSALKEVLGT